MENGGESACKVDVEYEWLPPKCNSCHTLGHTTSACDLQKPSKPAVSVYVQKPKRVPPTSVPIAARAPVIVDEPPTEPEIQPTTRVNKLHCLMHLTCYSPLMMMQLHFIALLETRVTVPNACRVQNAILPRWKWFVDYTSLGNRIWLAWDDDFLDITVMDMGVQFIHCRILFVAYMYTSGLLYLMVQMILGLGENCGRHSNIADSIGDVPWLVGGDFNAVRDLSEVCGTSGDIRNDGRSLWKRLDRMLANDKWMEWWPEVLYESLTPRTRITHHLSCAVTINALRAVDLRYLRPWARHIVTTEECDYLVRPVTKDEVKTVVFDIDEDRAPGPDGYSSGFFKAAWPVIGDELTAAVTDFFSTGQLLKQVNATLITLIPKVCAPSKVADFRPISCCNVIYKILTKILVLRFREYSQKSLAAHRMRARGLRQGDPMSSYLFVLVMEIFRRGLTLFASLSGLHTNPQKSHLILSKVAAGIRTSLLETLGFQEGRLPLSILGNGFLTTQGVIKEIVSRIRAFLWKGNSTSISKGCMENVCKPVEEGGQGIRDILAFNRALMSRHLWSVIRQEDSIWVDWIGHYRLRGLQYGQSTLNVVLGAGGRCLNCEIHYSLTSGSRWERANHSLFGMIHGIALDPLSSDSHVVLN
ncbi:UNVERIFIED_CONTAM: hypothetical protein Sangu_2747800 [Sesamum angustifolium]|uniref:Reverse transcriptase n=1 Tax=Sesamum angustifolium TaxID=2727405 RepID=A0AAW2IWL0_9LAMI